MRVLVAPDKFKGSLSAAQVADSIGEGLREAGVDDIRLPLADGGDGSVAAALSAGFQLRACAVVDAIGQRRSSCLAVGGSTAVVEVANTCGMQTFPAGVAAPILSSSFGFGEAIAAALRFGARRMVLALGGSASTDGGLGMLAALGYQFYDVTGLRVAATAQNLHRVHQLCRHDAVDLSGIELVIATDVTNPLTGPRGAARVFGPQKGATPADIRFLESGLANLVDAVGRSGWHDAEDLATSPGAGAAGGCGFAAMVLGGTAVSGAAYFLDLLGFDDHLSRVDVVVTGEGRLDDQTLNGKLPAVVARRAAPTPAIAVVGTNDLRSDTDLFAEIHSVAELAGSDTAADVALTADVLRRVGGCLGERLRQASRNSTMANGITPFDRTVLTPAMEQQLDRFDRQLMTWLQHWAPYGGPPEDELLSEFGMSRARLNQHVRDILAAASVDKLSSADRELFRLASSIARDRPSIPERTVPRFKRDRP